MFEIVFGKSIGNIKIGMKRENVKELFGEVDEWSEVPYGMNQEIVYNSFGNFLIAYNQDDCVDFINCDATDELVLKGKVINQMKYIELLKEIQNMDSELEEEEVVGFTSKKLGFGVSLDDDEEIDSVQVVVEGYYGW